MERSDLEVLYVNLQKMHRERANSLALDVDDSLFFITKEVLFGNLGIHENKANNNLLHALLECESNFSELLDVFGR